MWAKLRWRVEITLIKISFDGLKVLKKPGICKENPLQKRQGIFFVKEENRVLISLRLRLFFLLLLLLIWVLPMVQA